MNKFEIAKPTGKARLNVGFVGLHFDWSGGEFVILFIQLRDSETKFGGNGKSHEKILFIASYHDADDCVDFRCRHDSTPSFSWSCNYFLGVGLFFGSPHVDDD